MSIHQVSGAQLALLVARAMGLEQKLGIKLTATYVCLYKEVGEGAVPYAFRPDSNLSDAVQLIEEMSNAGVLTLIKDGAQFEAHGFGHVGFSDSSTAAAICRCYVSWKLGRDFNAQAE